MNPVVALCQGSQAGPQAPDFTDHLGLAVTTLILHNRQKKKRLLD